MAATDPYQYQAIDPASGMKLPGLAPGRVSSPSTAQTMAAPQALALRPGLRAAAPQTMGASPTPGGRVALSGASLLRLRGRGLLQRSGTPTLAPGRALLPANLAQHLNLPGTLATLAPEGGSGASASGGPATGGSLNASSPNLSGLTLASLGPVGLGISPFGSVGLNFNTGNRALDAGAKSVLGLGGKLAGIPTSLNLLSMLSPALAGVMGPVGATIGTTIALGRLGDSIARGMGITPVSDTMASINAGNKSLSDTNRGHAADITNTAEAVSAALGQGDHAGAQATIDAAVAAGVNPTAIANAMTGLPGGQGYAIGPTAQYGAGHSYSGPAGASATGVPGENGVSFAAQGGLTGTPGITVAGPSAATAQQTADAAVANAPTQTTTPTVAPDPTPTVAPTVDQTVDIEPNDPTTGAGDGSGGASCLLMNWAATHGPKGDAAGKNRRFFHELYQQFTAQYPARARRDFALYQRIARQIMAAADRQGPKAAAEAQGYIYQHLVKPLGAHLEAQEVPQALRAMIQVVKALAQRFDVALPQQAMQDAESAYSGRPPRPRARQGLIPIAPQHVATLQRYLASRRPAA